MNLDDLTTVGRCMGKNHTVSLSKRQTEWVVEMLTQAARLLRLNDDSASHRWLSMLGGVDERDEKD